MSEQQTSKELLQHGASIMERARGFISNHTYSTKAHSIIESMNAWIEAATAEPRPIDRSSIPHVAAHDCACADCVASEGPLVATSEPDAALQHIKGIVENCQTIPGDVCGGELDPVNAMYLVSARRIEAAREFLRSATPTKSDF